MIYLKNVNGVPTEAPTSMVIGNITYPAFNQNIEAMTANGYVPYENTDYDAYKLGQKLFVNGEFVLNPNYEAEQAEKEAQAQAMKCITKRQLWEWLRLNKQMMDADASIIAIINGLPEETIEGQNIKASARNNYLGTNTFYFGNSFVPLIADALGLTDNELKQCFAEAASL